MDKKKQDNNVMARAEMFEEFYRRNFQEIFRYVYRRIHNVQTAEDIVQETFCVAFVKLKDILVHSEPQQWLRCTAKFKMLELGRKMKYRETVPLEEESGLGREELRYRVKELELTAEAVLEEQEWQLVTAHYLYGITIAELAASEGISENNMRVKLYRIKKKLQK